MKSSKHGELTPPAAAAGEAGAGVAAPAAAVRLDQRTLLDKPKRSSTPASRDTSYRVLVRNYGDGLCEVGWAFIGQRPITICAKGESVERDVNEGRAARRAKSRVRQYILAARATHLLTLTYRENVIDFQRASDDLARFVRRMKVAKPGWVYIAVAEAQRRGAWHWHLAVVGRQDVIVAREIWQSIVGEGNIDVKAPPGNRREQSIGLARYLSKYLTKAIPTTAHKLNGHRFRASHSIAIPAALIYRPLNAATSLRDFALHTLTEAAGRVGHVWESPDLYCGWACSWGESK